MPRATMIPDPRTGAAKQPTGPATIFEQPCTWRAEAILRAGLDGLDAMVAASPGPGFPETLDRLAGLVELAQADRVVDIGSGLGGATAWMAAASSAVVVGVEPVPECVRASRALFPGLIVIEGGLNLHGADTSAALDGSADVVTGLGLVSLVPALADAVKALVRGVHPGGRVALVELLALRRTIHCGRNIFPTAAALRRLLERAGADLVSVEATPETGRRWSELDGAITAAIAGRCAGEAALAAWEQDQALLRDLQQRGLVRGGLVVARRRAPEA